MNEKPDVETAFNDLCGDIWAIWGPYIHMITYWLAGARWRRWLVALGCLLYFIAVLYLDSVL